MAFPESIIAQLLLPHQDLTEEQKRILAGKSTGDPVADFCLVNYGSRATALEPKLRALDTELAPGSEVLIVAEQKVAMGPPGCFGQPGIQQHFFRYGVLSGKPDWRSGAQVREGLLLPMQQYAWDDGQLWPTVWSVHESPIVLSPSELDDGRIYFGFGRQDLPTLRFWSHRNSDISNTKLDILTGEKLEEAFEVYDMMRRDSRQNDKHPTSRQEARLCINEGMPLKAFRDKQHHDSIAHCGETLRALAKAYFQYAPAEEVVARTNDAIALNLDRIALTAGYEQGVSISAPDFVLARIAQYEMDHWSRKPRD